MRAVLDNKRAGSRRDSCAREAGDSSRPRNAPLVADRAIGTDRKRFVLVLNGENKTQCREVKIGRLVEDRALSSPASVPAR
jgi:hypothetical protein